MPQRRLFVSDSFAVLQDAFVTAVQTSKRADPLLPLTILVPHAMLGAHLRRAVAQAGEGHLGLYIYTLAEFALALAGEALAQEGWRPLSPQTAALVVKQLLRSGEPDNYFAPLAHHPHFPRDVLATIADLQHAEIQPADLDTFLRQARPTGTYHQKMTSLFQLYEQYVRFLVKRRLYDGNVLLERATAALAAQRATTPLLLYGFSALSPLQRRLIAAGLQERDVLVFFPWREGAAYEYATPTLTWFTSLGFHYTRLPRPQGHGSDLTRVQTGLFTEQPAAGVPAGRDGSVTIVSAPSRSWEAREIGRAILALVRRHGLYFDEIAVFLRDAATYGPLLAETLEQLGIPCVLASGLPLSQTPAGQSLLLLCQVFAEDFARPRVMEFLTLADPPWPQGMAPVPRDRWDAFSCAAGIVRGLAQWRTRLPRLLLDFGSGTQAGESDEGCALQAFVEFMQEFLAACEQVPAQNTLRGWSEQMLRLFQTYVAPTPHTAAVGAELERIARLDLSDELLSAQEWYRTVAALLTTVRSALPAGDGCTRTATGVWVGELHAAYGVPFRAVILPGLVEGGFPQTARQDPLLLDAERQHLGEILLRQLPLRDRREEEERLLLLLALQSATERVMLSYPRFSPDGTRTQLPSSYLLRIGETLEGRPVSIAEFERWTVYVPPPPFHAGASPETALDALEFHLASAQKALESGEGTPLAYLCADSPFWARALRAAEHRWETPTLTAFDGVITDETVKTRLWHYLFPAPVTLSVQTLETYARCPFRFFLQTVLGLTPREEPERRTVLSPRDRGILLHRILSDFFRQLQLTGRLPLAAQDRAVLTRLLHQVADAHFRACTNATGFPLLWELEQERLLQHLQLLLQREYETDRQFLPAVFAVPFGTETQPAEPSFFPPAPVPFLLATGEEIRLQGHIDRIDVSRDQRRARIVDYKTGKTVNGRFAGGTALQLPLALFAARTLRPDVRWEAAEYRYVDALQGRGGAPFSDETWAETFAALRTIVTALVHHLRSGCFVSLPSSCRPCPFPLICGAHTELFYIRKLSDPRLHSLHVVRAIP
ncbi:MAG: exodeoxyribonuclease V subunit gamma [Candidatus Binatia bacterium]|nr:exodeoxyribonuclease V subunit gamma [Candidatus Binatia bacterium]